LQRNLIISQQAAEALADLYKPKHVSESKRLRNRR
jgi:hypothetical protein